MQEQIFQKLDKLTDPQLIDKLSIESMSFVPTYTQILVLLDQSNVAIQNIKNNKKTDVLSKIKSPLYPILFFIIIAISRIE